MSIFWIFVNKCDSWAIHIFFSLHKIACDHWQLLHTEIDSFNWCFAIYTNNSILSVTQITIYFIFFWIKSCVRSCSYSLVISFELEAKEKNNQKPAQVQRKKIVIFSFGRFSLHSIEVYLCKFYSTTN